MLDLKSILNSNKVVLLDTGDIHSESSRLFTVLFLSHFWTSTKSIWTPDADDYIANIIIEEAADIARTSIVYQDLLPQGREFNLSLGLIMQYPEQVLGEDPSQNSRAYKEIMNNVNTKIIGNIATDDMLSESLFHEDLDSKQIKDRIAGLRRGEWVVQLPSTGFHEEKPEILTLLPLPIPPGHAGGPYQTSSLSKQIRERSRERHCASDESHLIKKETNMFTNTPGDSIEDQAGSNGDSSNDNEGSGVAMPEIKGETYKHKAFLNNIVEVLTDGNEHHSIRDPMHKMMNSETADDLVEYEYVEKVIIGNGKIYYYPTKRGLDVIDEDLSPKEGGEKGFESLEHRVGARLIQEELEDQGYNTKLYHTPEDAAANATSATAENPVYDVYAYPTKDSPDDRRKVVEVETSTEKKGHTQDDFEKLTEAYGDGIWVVKNWDDAKELISHINEEVDEDITVFEKNFDTVCDDVDYTGIQDIYGITKLIN